MTLDPPSLVPMDPEDPASRDALLDRWVHLHHDLVDLTDVFQQADGLAAHRLSQHTAYLERQLGYLHEAYVRGLPSVNMGRCPFTDRLVEHTIDPLGLDGPWWSYHGPARPLEPLDGTWIGLTGAVAYADVEVLTAPWLTIPGPEVPYVLPDVLGQDGVEAVLATVPLGPHTGYAITYFAEDHPEDGRRPDTWGMDRCVFREDGRIRTTVNETIHTHHDFELAAWIEDGKLHWIAPEDPGLVLQHETDGCPYLDLPGDRGIVHMREAGIWTSPATDPHEETP